MKTDVKTPFYNNVQVFWHDEVYKIGSAIFLEADAFRFDRKTLPEIEKVLLNFLTEFVAQ